MFTLNNTEGYTQAQCDELNEEFEARYAAGEWDYLNDREQAEKAFCDEVSHR